MRMDSRSTTNLLLLSIALLLLASLVVPAATGQDQGPATSPGFAPDDIVVRVPAKLARDLELTPDDVHNLVESLARIAAWAGGAPTAPNSVPYARWNANEVAAIAVLRMCAAAEAQFQALGMADMDQDGTGEFGTLVEMAGAAEVRGAGRKLNPPVLAATFRDPSAAGSVTRSGYRFVIYLPDREGKGVIPDAESVGFRTINDDLAELHYCVYAWPDRYGETGRRTFVMDESGVVLSTDASVYSGDHAPRPGAAFAGGEVDMITGSPATNATGADGHRWVPLD